MDNSMHNDEVEKFEEDEEFFEGVANAANFINERLDDTIAPGALNNTVEEYAEDDKGEE